MAAFCPALPYQADASGIGGWWVGTIWPIRSTDLLTELLDDIHHHRAVYIAANAELRHLPGCDALHCRHGWMDSVRPDELRRKFNTRLYYSGAREDPRCWVDGVTSENGRHMWIDGSICPFLSSATAWEWARDTVADFVGHISVWLVCWMVFQQTGVWIVGEHGNTPGYHLSQIKPHQLCWCRSGRKYRKCHMQQDSAAFARFGI